jgi:hypothetical protein
MLQLNLTKGRNRLWQNIGLITPSTRSFFLVSEVLGELGSEIAEQVLNELSSGLQTYFALPSSAFLVNEQQPAISFR